MTYISESSTMSKALEEYEGNLPPLSAQNGRLSAILRRRHTLTLTRAARADPSQCGTMELAWYFHRPTPWRNGSKAFHTMSHCHPDAKPQPGLQGARAVPSPPPSGWASSWGTTASRTRGSTATMWWPSAPRTCPPASAPSPWPSSPPPPPWRAPSCASGAAIWAEVAPFSWIHFIDILYFATDRFASIPVAVTSIPEPGVQPILYM